jgi:hypothetical protein
MSTREGFPSIIFIALADQLSRWPRFCPTPDVLPHTPVRPHSFRVPSDASIKSLCCSIHRPRYQLLVPRQPAGATREPSSPDVTFHRHPMKFTVTAAAAYAASSPQCQPRIKSAHFLGTSSLLRTRTASSARRVRTGAGMVALMPMPATQVAHGGMHAGSSTHLH